MRLAELASTGPVVLLDASIVRDIASGLTGVWVPSAEDYPSRAEEVMAAARIRLYGDRARSGWTLLVTRQGRDRARKRGDADWSVGMLPAAEDFDEAPSPAEVDALVGIYRKEAGLDADNARTLATAMLFDAIGVIVTRVPRAMRHSRGGDLPTRLEIIDPFEAVARLEISAGEEPQISLPVGSELTRVEPWWVPAPA